MTTSPLRRPRHDIGTNITIATGDPLRLHRTTGLHRPRRLRTTEGIPDILMISGPLTIDLLHRHRTTGLPLPRRLRTTEGIPDILMISGPLTIDLLHRHRTTDLPRRLHTMKDNLDTVHQTVDHRLQDTMDIHLRRRLHTMTKDDPDILMIMVHPTIGPLLHHLLHTTKENPDILTNTVHHTIDHRLHDTMDIHPHRRLHMMMKDNIDILMTSVPHTIGVPLHRRPHTMKDNPDILMTSVHLTIDLRLHRTMALQVLKTIDNLMTIVGLHRMAKNHLVITGILVDLDHTTMGSNQAMKIQ
ncbi:uncharacterized protein LOC125229083 [Leguminivora glycinivorella]|uniref:uncharacterized protein LOC125229083 n=1 Tax=Leguminivora glycinivorella TaxID=1035111 RepID=UPI00200DF473|nr:uncharacterized protein LOC125229083 [Leguminivora glycinivorella]